ncbi:MAG: hypothetical protein AB7V62_08400 [Thermoleophilia bacterium]
MRLSRTYADDTGAGWIAPEPAVMLRASHAIVAGDGTWLVDPVDGEGLDDLLAPLPPVRGVLQLLDRHPRDCAPLAERFGVPLHVTPGEAVPGLPLRVVPLTRRRWWRETALWWPETRSLVVPESLGTSPYFLARAGDPLGVHPAIRLTPPRGLRAFEASRLLCGHGAPAAGEGTADAIRRALDGSRRDLPGVLWRTLRHRGRPPA